MTRQKFKQLFTLHWLIIILLSFVIVVGAVAFYMFASRDSDPIPPSIRPQLTFSPFVLQPKAKYFTASAYKFSTVEDGTQILSFLLHTQNQNTIALSEYTQPSQFTDIPDYQTQFLTNVAQQYDTVQASNGTIYLGHLARQQNQQLGVMLERGLIVFMKPTRPLNNATWRDLGDQLQIQKIVN